MFVSSYIHILQVILSSRLLPGVSGNHLTVYPCSTETSVCRCGVQCPPSDGKPLHRRGESRQRDPASLGEAVPVLCVPPGGTIHGELDLQAQGAPHVPAEEGELLRGCSGQAGGEPRPCFQPDGQTGQPAARHLARDGGLRPTGDVPRHEAPARQPGLL